MPLDQAMPVQPEADYTRFLEEGRFMLLRGAASGRYVFYPRVVEPVTGATDLEWVEASGKGTVYSTTVVRVRPPKPSYNVALIDLAEGPRMMSQVVDIAPEDVAIGMAVKAKVASRDGKAILVFEPADTSDR